MLFDLGLGCLCFWVKERAVKGLRNDSSLWPDVASSKSTPPYLRCPYRHFVSITKFDFFYNYFLMNCDGKKPGTSMTSLWTVNSPWPQEALVALGQVLWWDLCHKLNKPFSILITGHGKLFMDSVIQPYCCSLGLEVLRCDCWQEIHRKILRWSVHRSVSSAHTHWNWTDYIWSNSRL